MSQFSKERVLMLGPRAWQVSKFKGTLLPWAFTATPLRLLDRKTLGHQRSYHSMALAGQRVSAVLLFNGFKIFRKYFKYLGYSYLATVSL